MYRGSECTESARMWRECAVSAQRGCEDVQRGCECTERVLGCDARANPQKVHLPHTEHSNDVFQKLLIIIIIFENLHLSFTVCIILMLEFPIFNLWVRPLWFSTLHVGERTSCAGPT